jgi:predicted transcriptional regulator
MMKPFAPVVRFLGLPLHEEIQDVLRLLDHTNKRLDEMPPKFHELNLELAKVRERLDTRLVDLDRSMEYIKLLHHLDHNLVVEITKFRIEFETLRTKVQILEKDLDTGAQRERILEKQLLS